MMYQLASRREEAVTVDGLGVLQPGEVKDVTETELAHFVNSRGLLPHQVNMPEGVEVTIKIGAEPVENTEEDPEGVK